MLNFFHNSSEGEFGMIIIHDFGVNLNEYAAKGRENDFPILDKCPNCKCHSLGNIHRHGYYWRYGVTEDESLHIPICRMKCLQCKITFSILPDFFIPYFQYTIHTIVQRISDYLEAKKVNDNRQLLGFYLARFYKNLKWMYSFLVTLGKVGGFSKDINKEAIRYVKILRNLGESIFFQMSWGHNGSYFMAN